MRSLPLLMLLFSLPAQAVDVIDWAPSEENASIIFRGAGFIKEALDGLEARFKDEAQIQAAIQRLRAWERLGMRPAQGEWGEGLALEKGLALFIKGKKNLRFVMGISDLGKAKTTLLAYAKLAEVPLQFTAEGLQVDDLKFLCAQREGFFICDTDGVPQERSKAPSGLSKEAIFEVQLRGPLMAKIAEGKPVQSFKLIWLRGGELKAQLQLLPPLQGMLAPFQVGKEPARGLEVIDARSPGLFKLSFDGPKIFAAVESQTGPPPPPIAPLWSALKSNLSGDLNISLAGGLLHPIFSFGLQKGGSAEKILNPLFALLNQQQSFRGFKLSHEKGTINLEIAPFPALELEDPVHFKLRFGTCGDSFILALAEADIKRCQEKRVQKAQLPAALSSKGQHGFVIWDVPSLFPGGYLPGFFEGGGDLQAFSDLQDLLSIRSLSVEEMGLALSVEGLNVNLDLWCKLPKGDKEGAARFDQAIALDLSGDALGAEELLLKLMSERPNTTYGRLAQRRLMGSSLLLGVAGVGILSAIAIPAFIKYIRRAKTAEATMNLRKMFDGAVVFYESERVDKNGNILPRRFPQSSPLSPKLSKCKEKAVLAPPETWAAQGWRELEFAIHGPQHYQYEFVSEGHGEEARFTARAIGDLDCDGVFSTFERIGEIRAGSINGGAGLYIEKQFE